MNQNNFNYFIPLIVKRKNVINTNLHIALLFKGKKLITYAFNKIGSRSNGCGYNNATLHAEIAVLKKLGDISAIKGLRLVVLRYGVRDSTWTQSRPCVDCQKILNKFIKHFGLHSVHYST